VIGERWFVPEGRNDGSLAVYCLGNAIRPSATKSYYPFGTRPTRPYEVR
jgi:hypothetical protein